MKRSLSGIKPTGRPHLGNLYGMILPAIELQETHRAFYFLADYHALTTARDPKEVRLHSLEIAATFLAFGLKAGKSGNGNGNAPLLFRQSAIPEVHELAWMLSCVTGVGTMNRCHAVKAAEAKGETLNLGTYTYPALMAADILLYGSDVVPVGRDQHQHVQVAQEMATHFNAVYGPALKVPETRISLAATVVGSDGEKMAKSRGNYLSIFAEDRDIAKYVKAMKTDSTPLEAPKDPMECPVANLFRVVAPTQDSAEMDRRYLEGGYGYGHAKAWLVEALVEFLKGPRDTYQRIMGDPTTLELCLRRDALVARTEAEKTIQRVRQAVGIPCNPYGDQ